MRGRSLQRRALSALGLALAFAAGPATTPAHAASCTELTLYVIWTGTDPTGQPTTPVHDGCILETGGTAGVTVEKGSGGDSPPGTPNGYYLYLRVPIPLV